MPTLNLGILAHVDAGKTSLTERLLHRAGVIAELGSVDRGDTTTDSLALERRRGITIRAAVASFPIGDLTVNLVDTPGHPDFIAEVERALVVLDGAVLVLSAVEGVQAQTRVLMRALRRLRIPTLIFVNKVDRTGADPAAVLRRIDAVLTDTAVPMIDGLDVERATEVLAGQDDGVLAAFVDGTLDRPAIDAALIAQTARAAVHPVLAGSAVTGAGIDALVGAIGTLLPTATGDAGAPPSGVVFAIERDDAGERVAYVRLLDGTVRVRDRVAVDGVEMRITAIDPVDDGAPGVLTAGRIARIHGWAAARIGDPVGRAPRHRAARQFAPPGLEAVVEPVDPAQRGDLRTALGQLADQDPLIALRQDDRTGELAVSLYGDVQREVIEAVLAEEYGVQASFRAVSPICLEVPSGVGAAEEVIEVGDNPFLATVGLRVEPGAPGSGVTFGIEVELGSMPYAFMRAVEDTVHATLREGLHGWPVTDVGVTMTRSGYWPRQSHAHQKFDKSMSSTAGDFRNLTPLVLMSALARAGTQVLEPVERFRLEVPARSVNLLWPLLAALEAVPGAPVGAGGSGVVVEGRIAAMRVPELAQQLAGLTAGEGVLEVEPGGHRPARGTPPSRARTDHDPLDRRRYLLRVTRRAGTAP